MSCFELVWRVFLALLISGALSASAEVRTVDRVVGARAIQGEIVLDGVLNESDWQGPAATGFTQREPVDEVNLTPDLSTSAFVQFSDAAELLAANLRLGWTYRPGADVFLVLNQRWDAPSLGLRTVRDRQAILKLTYLIAV